ncbi:MAG TPA: DUF1801 domain-containing protein [Candidatus Limnocylindria bacterium]|nr:DUF1801 domain-containing protein [Candidatus Limnocylindria bacterium]
MTSKAKTVDAFLAELPAERRAVLEPLRKAIGKAAPKAVESMDYGMPCWKIGGEMLCALNAQKHYFAFYIGSSAHAACADLLKGLDCGRSCIRFKRAEQLPASAITKLVKARLQDA